MADITLDDGEPTGAIVQRLTDDETAGLLNGLYMAQGRIWRSDPEAGRAFAAAVRKLESLIGDDVCGLEVRAVRLDRAQ